MTDAKKDAHIQINYDSIKRNQYIYIPLMKGAKTQLGFK